MQPSDWLKWLYTFVLLGVTIGWGVFCVNVIRAALLIPSVTGILETAGVASVMGALISWNALVIQHWFRKKSPE
jgi:hypothetical protein